MTLLTRPGPSTAIARPRTFLNLVLDESSSMDDIKARTLSAVNEFLDDQRRDRIDELFVTITLFGSPGKVRTLCKAVPIAELAPLTGQQYRPQGMTALYDGIAFALADMAKAAGAGDRVLNVIVTDGEENASREVRSLDHLLAIKRNYEARGNWTFVFLAANIDAVKVGADMGFQPGNVNSYDADDQGVGQAMQRVSQNLKTYRTRDDLSTDTFYHPPKRWSRPQWASSPQVSLTDDEE